MKKIIILLLLLNFNFTNSFSIEADVFVQSTVNRAAETLGKWGFGPGCYLVLPVLGPSTIRDTTGSFANIMGGDPWYNASVHGNNEFLSEGAYIASKAITGIEFRANNIESFENLEENSIDFYASVRSLYLQDRENKIQNVQQGNVEVIYEDDDGWEEIETNK